MARKQGRVQTLDNALDSRRRRQIARADGLRSSLSGSAARRTEFSDQMVEVQHLKRSDVAGDAREIVCCHLR